MGTLSKILVAGTAFAFGALLVWELWLKNVWEALALPRLYHYWYGILCMLGALTFICARAIDAPNMPCSQLGLYGSGVIFLILSTILAGF